MEKRDVVVVGAGPSGSAAAKKCAQYGLRTLMLEKRQLPRNKICSGMIMGPVAQSLIKQEFGDLPENIFSRPSCLKGFMFHVPGIGSKRLESVTPLTWRRDLDYWMNLKAQSEGVEIWQATKAVSLRQIGQVYLLKVERDSVQCEIETKFIIGADGATSLIRKFLFPDLVVKYAQTYQEHYYLGGLELDKEYFHWFFPIEYSPSSFSVHHKDDLLVVDVTGRVGRTGELKRCAIDFLASNFGFAFTQKPVWKGSCLEPIMYRALTSHLFLPARENVLLVGDAAGLLLPVTGEGIGAGLKSGLLAAESVSEALKSGERSDVIYLGRIRDIVNMFRETYPWFDRIVEETKAGGQSLATLLCDAYQSTLRTF